ncbi:MAG: hypothetical protein IJ184_06195 [Alphaproteobacteria bacterium]|nr:hypothetical protein [Alphaproteobacteria bacterium]
MAETKQIYNAVYADGSFEKIALGKMINKGGASGKIYLIDKKPDYVAKIFHSTDKSATNRQKLQAMLLNKPDFRSVNVDGDEYIQIAWPEALLDDERGFCVGYIMPLIDMERAVSLDHFMQKAVRQKLGLSEKYAYRVFAAYNVALMINALHKCGHYVIDLKPSNIYVYKKTMLVAMVDCDGFAIAGENTRYPAEFVSEEYIYPEGMKLSCAEMGEEQDLFALAVIIFRLLNNGIHPFSGTPKNKNAAMLTIQNRIEQYHYAYGLWPDDYQYPHPYSIHEYFNKETLELFERAFCQDCKRPTAFEWQEHLWKLMHGLKKCHNNPNHAYFTSKGCGLCLVDGKFNRKLDELKKQKQEPETLRGIEISHMNTEKIQAQKEHLRQFDTRMRAVFAGLCLLYVVFFTLLHKLLMPFSPRLQHISLGLQIIAEITILFWVNRMFKYGAHYFKPLQNKIISNVLQIYAFIWLTIALVLANDLPLDLFELAP